MVDRCRLGGGAVRIKIRKKLSSRGSIESINLLS
jgi:hypothetical protein